MKDIVKNMKDLNVNKIVQLLFANKTRTLSGVFVVLGIIGLLMIFDGYRARAAGQEQDMKRLQEKMDIVSQHDLSVKALKDFLAALPRPLEDEKLIGQIADYAAQNNVAILNYAPGLSKSEKLYDSSTMRLSVSVSKFNDLLAFVHTIERSPYFLKIGSLTGGVKDNAHTAGPLTVEMSVSCVRMKK
ncbi:MAG: hypothetical protein HYZ86_00185 [Candidatus Omnitrophica bacterium]|nr:hypothetical protein [Candidatus Omnitrophota bacterium]